MRRYQVSDEVVRWVESLVGLVTKIGTQYGGVAEMLERPDWDSSKTDYLEKLLGGLCDRLYDIKREIADHVSQRPL